MESMYENAVLYCVNVPVDPATQAMTDAKEAREFAAKTNDYFYQGTQNHAGRIGSWASVSLHDANTAATKLRRCIS